MAGELDGLEIGVPCPGCGHETKKRLGWLKTHNQLTCGGCKKVIDLDDAGFRQGLKDAERAIADLRKSFK